MAITGVAAFALVPRRLVLGSDRKVRAGPRHAGTGAPVGDDAIAAVLERARAGDREAFGDLFRGVQPDVSRLCRRMLNDPAAAEDATSEVFLRARRALASYDPEQSFRGWLLAIASNHCIDQIRRRGVERQIFAVADVDEGSLVDPGPDPLKRMAKLEAREEIVNAVDALPAKYRLPLVLRFYNDLDYDEIAEILGVTRNQVGTLLFRAKRRLRETLDPGLAGASEPGPERSNR